MTSQKQISLFTEDRSTSSQEDSLANPTQQQESDLAKKMTVTSGRRCLEQYGRFNRHGLWAKTFSDLLIGTGDWYSTRCRLTWKLKGTKYNRMYFQLYPSTLPIEETEYGLLPTPRANESTESIETIELRRQKTGIGMMNLTAAVQKLLPTPQAMDSMTNPRRDITPSGRIISNQGHNGSAPLKDLAMNGLLPTPTAIEVHNSERVAKIKGNQDTLKSRENGDNIQNSIMNFLDFNGLLPTPRVKGHGNSHQRIEDGKIDDLTTMARFNMLPTPMASDCGEKVTGLENQDSLVKMARETTGQTSQLNPQFVCEMMGFPPDWTLIPFLKLNGETNQSKPEGMQ